MLRIVGKLKEKLLTVRLSEDVHRDYKLAAELKGGTMSGLVHMFIIHTIREQRERNPGMFTRQKNEYERPVLTAKLRRSKGKVRSAKR